MTQHTKELSQIQTAADDFFPEGAFIAGGALTSVFTNSPINDVDIYFKNRAAFITAVGNAYEEGMWCVAASDRAVTFAKNKSIVQLMHFEYFPTAGAVFDAFDFTVAMAAYDIDNKAFVFHDDFFKHAAQRQLKFHSGTRYPYGSLLRVLKYQNRGYKIGASDMLRIGLSVRKVKMETWDDLAAAIGGQYGEKALIETDKPFSFDAAMDLFKDTDEIKTQKVSKAMPSSASELLKEIGIEVTTEDGFTDEDLACLKGW